MPMKLKIETRDDADRAISRVNEIELTLAERALEMANALAEARARCQEKNLLFKVPVLEEERNRLLAGLEIYAENAREEWDGRKSIQLAAGEIGFRQSPPSVALVKKVAKTFDAALELVKRYFPRYARRVDTLDKEQILADEKGIQPVLEKCGLKIVRPEKFWCETFSSASLDEAAKKLKEA